MEVDADGDLIVPRQRKGFIQIEHKKSTELSLVGLQVWRGALILADFLFHNRKKFADKQILELGSGVGLTSIAASIYAQRNIVCTDIDLGGLLDLLKSNVELNKQMIDNRVTVQVMELNFKDRNWSNELQTAVKNASLIIAADVIYDNDITDEFVVTLSQILDPDTYNHRRDKEVYIALEKRYVFTLADLDTTAPCYEYFLQRFEEAQKINHWQLDQVPIDFPQYFDYLRSKEFVLMKLYIK